jgi:hypothetical protein
MMISNNAIMMLGLNNATAQFSMRSESMIYSWTSLMLNKSRLFNNSKYKSTAHLLLDAAYPFTN